MIIKTLDIPVYYLNPDSPIFASKRSNMENLLSSIGFKYFRFPSNYESDTRIVRVCIGQLNLIQFAISKNIFPFLFLEDDVALNVNSLPETIEIPSESNIIYWGASTYRCGSTDSLKIKYYNQNYYKIENSLSTHAFLIPSVNSAKYFISILQSAIESSSFQDIMLATDSKNQIFLTPVDGPYFYQTDSHTQPITKFLWSDNLHTYLDK